MRRLAALLALLVPLTAQAETYAKVLTIGVPTGCQAIAATHSDSVYIANFFLDKAESFDSIRISCSGYPIGFTGDGFPFGRMDLEPIGTHRAITTQNTSFSRVSFAVRHELPYWVVDVIGTYLAPVQGDVYLDPCMKPNSAIGSDQDSNFYVFGGCTAGAPLEVRKFAPTGPQIAAPLATFGSFTDPRFIAVAPDGHAYVTSGDRGVSKFGPDGSAMGEWPMSDPGPIATDRDGNVFVIDLASRTITKRDPAGAELASWQSHATQGISVSEYGSVYLLSDRGSVEKWVVTASTPAAAATWGQVKARWR